jgi:hypothetical protein
VLALRSVDRPARKGEALKNLYSLLSDLGRKPIVYNTNHLYRLCGSHNPHLSPSVTKWPERICRSSVGGMNLLSEQCVSPVSAIHYSLIIHILIPTSLRPCHQAGWEADLNQHRCEHHEDHRETRYAAEWNRPQRALIEPKQLQ